VLLRSVTIAGAADSGETALALLQRFWTSQVVRSRTIRSVHGATMFAPSVQVAHSYSLSPVPWLFAYRTTGMKPGKPCRLLPPGDLPRRGARRLSLFQSGRDGWGRQYGPANWTPSHEHLPRTKRLALAVRLPNRCLLVQAGCRNTFAGPPLRRRARAFSGNFRI